jgi:CheY-like chemotaxis protein/AraC-like DNA-binding protein
MREFTILVIEDDPDMLDNIRDLLEINGFTVKVHLGGTTVLDRITSLKPDLIIVDWMLPGMDGVSIVKYMRESDTFKNTPCIMLTAKSATTDIVSGYQHGVDVYLTKPFESSVLLAVVSQMRARYKETETVDEESILSLYNSKSTFVRKFLDLVAKNYGNPSVKLKDYAKLMCCSTSSLNAKINHYTGQAPYAIILEYRLLRSQVMLRDAQYNVTETAYSCGFTSLSGFSIAYKKKFGTSPKNRSNFDL